MGLEVGSTVGTTVNVDIDPDAETHPSVLIGLTDTEEEDDGGVDASTGRPVTVRVHEDV